MHIYPTYKIAPLGLLELYGLILPSSSATGTLLFQQFFITVPTISSKPPNRRARVPLFKDTLVPRP